MIKIKQKTFVLGILGIVLLILSPMSSVMAQEEEPIGGDRGVDVIAGPHSVRVVLINSNLAAGFVQLALFITDANTGEATFTPIFIVSPLVGLMVLMFGQKCPDVTTPGVFSSRGSIRLTI